MTGTSTGEKRMVRGLVPLLATLSSLGPFAVDAYLPAMKAIGDALASPPVAVQQTLTAYMIPFAIMSLWHGSLSDAIGRRTVVLWGTALFALASLACTIAPNLESLLLFRALQGMTAGAGMIVGRAMVRDLYDGAAAQRAMAHVSLMFALAPAVAPVVGGWLLATLGWRAVFGFLVLFAGGTWLWCLRALPETLPAAARRPLHAGHLLRSCARAIAMPRFLALCLVITLMFSGFFIYVMSAPVFLMRHLGVSATGFLWLFGPATLGIAGGSLLSGHTAGKMTARRSLAWAFGLMAAGAASNLALHLTLPASLPWSVMPLFVYALGMALAFPVLTLMALDLFPKQRGLAASCQSFIQTLGAAGNALLAPLVWGSAATLALTQMGFLLFALLGLALIAPNARTLPRDLPV